MNLNLNPLAYLPQRWLPMPQKGMKDAGDLSGSTLTRRESEDQGQWTQTFQDYVAREVNPRLYEAIREALGPVHASITWLIVLDGIVRVEGKNEALVAEIKAWMENVPVNDANMLRGLQALYVLQGNEMYEQGFSIAQWSYAPDGSDVVLLRVADSKGVYFRRQDGVLQCWYRRPRPWPQRRDGLANIERILRNTLPQDIGAFLKDNSYKQVDMTRVAYCALNPENDNPYGVSLMRGIEFVSRTLLTIQNAVQRVWSRLGDPSFHLNYKTANRRLDSTQLENRRKQFATDLQTVLDIKRQGNSADLVTAMGADDTIELKIIGGDLTIPSSKEAQADAMTHLISVTHLPAWLLSMDFSAAARMAPKQMELLLQDSKTRWEMRKPGLTAVVEAMLRARGRTWNPGDWELVQELPNIADTLANAQANFYDAQATMMRNNAGLPPAESDPEIENDGTDGEEGKGLQLPGISWLLRKLMGKRRRRKLAKHSHKESFAQDDPELPRLEAKAEMACVTAWRGLQVATLKQLGLDGGGKSYKASEDNNTYVFDAGQIPELQALQDAYANSLGAADSALIQAMVAALGRGVANGAAEFDTDAVTQAIAARNADAMREHGLQQVKDSTVKAYQDEIVKALADGEYDGMAPDDVAAALAQRFDAGEYNWRLLGRTEIANAQVEGKLDQYEAQGIQEYDWIAAPDACPICQDLADGGPYPVGTGPSIMDDSHPNCRCTVEAAQPD